MTERWISQSQELLKVLEELASKKGEDRLELVNAMFYALNVIDRSMGGWRSWLQNLSLMSRFSEEELREMKEELVNQARSFIEYDIRVSEKHRDKVPRISVVRRPPEEGPPGLGPRPV